MKNGTQPAPASRNATRNRGWRSKTPPETIHQTELFGLGHDVDCQLPVFDRRHRHAAQRPPDEAQ